MSLLGRFVVVRTFSAGVHCGTLAESFGTAVRLTNARRIWRWSGANTLHELSLRGSTGTQHRISEPVSEIVLTQAVEIIPCATESQTNLENSRWNY